MKIYTQGGDKGETSLVGGKRVKKDNIKVECYGTIDELNSIIGVVRAFNNNYKNKNDAYQRLDTELKIIQNTLLNIGSILATPIDKISINATRIREEDILLLENNIDTMTEELKPLTSFILPGGGKVSAYLHYARTVCRRTERQIVMLTSFEEVNPLILKYINRLGDTLFTMARWTSLKYNEPEYLWEK